MKPGDLLHVVGTTQVLAALTERPEPSPRRLIHHLGVGDHYVYVTHNPVSGAALDWLRQLCFRDQAAPDFFEKTIAEALQCSTRVTLDPPFLGGDRLEIEAHRAAFRDLTLATDRIELLTALLEAMRRRHRAAVADLGLGDSFERIFLSGGGADVVRRLLPEYSERKVQFLKEASLCGVAHLF
jgi:sugar (pentulose or hexulose) kinase